MAMFNSYVKLLEGKQWPKTAGSNYRNQPAQLAGCTIERATFWPTPSSSQIRWLSSLPSAVLKPCDGWWPCHSVDCLVENGLGRYDLSIDRSIRLSTYPPIHLSIYPSIDLSTYPPIHLSIYPSIHPSIDLSIYIYLYLSLSISIYLYLSIYRSIDLSVYRSIGLSIDRSIYLSIDLSIS